MTGAFRDALQQLPGESFPGAPAIAVRWCPGRQCAVVHRAAKRAVGWINGRVHRLKGRTRLLITHRAAWPGWTAGRTLLRNLPACASQSGPSGSSYNILNNFFLRLLCRVSIGGNSTRGGRGHEKSRIHSRGSEGGLEFNRSSSTFPSSCRWRDRRPITRSGLDEHEQAGLLASRSSYWLRLTAQLQWLDEAFVARYSGATARDPHPLPYSPQTLVWSTCSRRPTRYSGATQRTALHIAASNPACQQIFS